MYTISAVPLCVSVNKSWLFVILVRLISVLLPFCYTCGIGVGEYT